ncbi:MAG: manganese efflux pump MntP family protein [Siculibacillus sp.]|nr:manganese efflux pump MntP family protein [Siculibacillus sp.]
MSLLALVLLALGSSVDAFAASVGRGVVADTRPGPLLAMRTGLVFGLVEMSAPVIGWLLGTTFAGHVEAIDHWIAFVLLVGVGGHMVWEVTRGEETAEAPKGSLLLLIVTAIGTSIDSMVVGVSLALLDVDILVAAPIIGATTFILSSIGMYAGKAIGERFGHRAELVAGLGLALLGCGILWSHTMA